MLPHSSRATKCAANGKLAATAVVSDTPKSLTHPLLCLRYRTPPSFIPFVSLASAKLWCVPVTRCLHGGEFEGNLFFFLFFFWTIFEPLRLATVLVKMNENSKRIIFLKRGEKV